MRKSLIVCLMPLALLARVEDSETTKQTYGFASRIDVSNINGSVRVTGGGGNSIQMVVQKKISARDATELERAKREVRLDVTSTGDVFRACVTGPWGDCNDRDRSRNRDRRDERDYDVRFDIELQVPASVSAELKTVNGGVSLKAINGTFEVKSVNGGVTVEDAGGAGSATTVNGAVKLSFRNVPTASVHAKTVNGTIDAAFPRSLNANIKFKTFNGEVFTSFPATMLAREAPQAEQRGGRTVYKSDRSFSVKVGGGGPEHSFETLNGSIQIAERE